MKGLRRLFVFEPSCPCQSYQLIGPVLQLFSPFCSYPVSVLKGGLHEILSRGLWQHHFKLGVSLTNCSIDQ